MTSAILLSIKIGLDPTLFKVAGLEVTWHGVFTALAVVAGVAMAVYLGRRVGFDEDAIYNVALALVIGGIIGARGLYVLENWGAGADEVNSLREVLDITEGGISIYGALIGGAIAAWGYAYLTRLQNIPKAADIAAIGAILGMATGRIGDIINGEHFAKVTSLPWGVEYTHANSPSVRQELAGELVDPVVVQPQHPAVAYELLGDMAIFFLLLVIYARVTRSGVTFFAWMVLYGALRLGVSFLRLDDIVLVGLRTAQLIGIASMALALPAIIYLLRTPPQEEQPGLADEGPPTGEEGAEGEPAEG